MTTSLGSSSRTRSTYILSELRNICTLCTLQYIALKRAFIEKGFQIEFSFSENSIYRYITLMDIALFCGEEIISFVENVTRRFSDKYECKRDEI